MDPSASTYFGSFEPPAEFPKTNEGGKTRPKSLLVSKTCIVSTSFFSENWETDIRNTDPIVGSRV